MGKIGRFACILTPLLLTLAALLCVVTVMLGGINKNLAKRNNFYFFKADTSGFNAKPEASFVSDHGADAKLLEELFKEVNTTTKLQDFYTVSLWGYCNGTIDNGNHRIDDCSKASGSFWFDPVHVWGLNNTGSDNVPKRLRDALNAYRTASRWMLTAYIVAGIALVVEVIVGCFAIFSRWGSFVTTIIASVAAIFTLVASALATGIYGTMKGSFDTILKPYGIRASLGRNMYSMSWMGTALAAAAALFWLFSTCCCSGRSNARPSKTNAKETPYDYAPVTGPFGARQAYNPHGGPNMPMHNLGPAGHAPQQPQGYEPYRHNAV